MNLKLEKEGLIRLICVVASGSHSMWVHPHNRDVTEDQIPWALLWGATKFWSVICCFYVPCGWKAPFWLFFLYLC